MTTLTDFLKDWQQDAITAVKAQTPTIAWCPVCETRETRKAFTPYCSQLCLEAAQRNELMDRR